MRQKNRETKENQRDEKGHMLLLFTKVRIGCVLDKSGKVIIEVVKNNYMGSFTAEGYYLFFLITSKYFVKSSVVKCTIILFQSLIDLT